MNYPRCGSTYVVKNGINLSNKQKYKCGEYMKQFILNLQHYISEEKKGIMDKLFGSGIKLSNKLNGSKIRKITVISIISLPNKFYLPS